MNKEELDIFFDNCKKRDNELNKDLLQITISSCDKK